MTRLEELISQAQAGDRQAMDALVEENAGLIWAIVRRFLGREQRLRICTSLAVWDF